MADRSDGEDDAYDDDDNDDDLEEDEAQFVYHRGDMHAGLEALVRAPPAGRPAHVAHVSAQQAAKKEEELSFCAAFMNELAEIKAIKGVTVAAHAKMARITINGPPRLQSAPAAIILEIGVPPDYPKSAAEILLLPPQAMQFHDARLAMRGALRIHESRVGEATVAAVVRHLSGWLSDPAAQRESHDEELARKADEERAAREAEAQTAAAEQAERDRLDAEAIVNWAPLTAAEEMQRSTAIVVAPCKVFTDLALPRAFHLSAARVGGRVFMYGGTVPRHNNNNTYSTALHILHIASRRVETHATSLRRPTDRWPLMLTSHASCAVGQSVFLFGGLQTYQPTSWTSAVSFTGNVCVWELNTSTLGWRLSGTLPDWRQHCTATAIDNRRIVLFGGSGATPKALPDPSLGLPLTENTTYFDNVLVYDTVTGAVTTPKLTSANGKFPAGRFGHSAVLWQNKIIVYGGRGYELYGDVWVLDTVTWRWHGPQKPATDEVRPHGRAHHTACLLGSQMIVYGGEEQLGRKVNDLLLYDIPTRSFRRLEVHLLRGHRHKYRPQTQTQTRTQP